MPFLKTLYHRVSPIVFWVLVTVYIPLCILLLGVKWLALPLADEYRPRVERMLTQTFGQTVHVERMEARWTGLRPQLLLHNVQVQQPNGEQGFSSKTVRLDWSLWGLLALNPNLKNLEVIDPVLNVRRNANGQWVLAGHVLRPSGQDHNPALDWLLKQRRVFVQNAKVQLVDELGHLPSTQVESAEFLLHNAFGRHQAALRMKSSALGPQALNLNVDFRTPLIGAHPSQWSRWHGTALIDGAIQNHETLDPLFKALKLPVRIQHPQGQFWTEFQGQELLHSVFDLNIKQLHFLGREDVSQTLLRVNQVHALLEMEGLREWFKPQAFTVKHLTGMLPNQLPVGPATVGFSHSKDQPESTRWLLQFQNLDVGKAKHVLEGLEPVLGSVRGFDQLKDYELSGVFNQLNVSWLSPAVHSQMESSTPLAFQTDAVFKELTVLHTVQTEAGPQQSGLRRISGRVQGNHQKGAWTIEGTQAELLLPALFEPLGFVLDQVQGQGTWENLLSADSPTRIQIEHLQASNPDAEGNVSGLVELPLEGKPFLDLKGQIHRAEVEKVPMYLPLLLSQKVRAWLDQALTGGQVRGGQFELQGKLSDFPFKDKAHPGRFRVDAPFENAGLHYADGWPEVTHAKGKAVFDGASMHIESESAQTHNLSLTRGKASIEVLGPTPSPLILSAQADGELSQMVAFVNDSPVGLWLHNALSKAEADGNAQVDIQLQVPILDLPKTTVNGVLHLKDNSASLVPSMPKASKLQGDVRFSNKGILIDDLQGEALGGALFVEGSTNEHGVIQIEAKGLAKASGIAQFLNPLLEPYLSGESAYVVNVLNQEGKLDIAVNSKLQGIELRLPEPLKKKAELAMPLSVSQSLLPNGVSRLNVDLGDDTAKVRSISSDKNTGSALDALQFSVGDTPLPPPISGVQGDIKVPLLDADAWRGVYKQISGQIPGHQGQTAPSGLLGSLLMPKQSGTPFLPISVRVRADQLHIGSKQFDRVGLAARTIEKRWQFEVNAKGIDGYFSWVQDSLRPDGAVLARFKTLSIPKTLDKGLKALVEEPASTIPALDVKVDDLTMNGIKLGALTLKATNQGIDEKASEVRTDREWHLDELVVENSDSRTTASGVWRYTPGLTQQTTDIELNQVIHNTGGFLNRLGMHDVFRGGESALVGKLHWNDAPMNIDYATLGGRLKLHSKKGQFLKADPGAAKLLGVLSLQGVARRFTLDFKDLFSQGLAYDEIEADVLLDKGLANTPNFKMTAPSVTVLMDGRLDIKAETQDLNVLVLPDLSPTGGSLVYSLVVANPAVGLVSLIADFILKDPLSKVFSIQYKVTGPWASPVLERINKSVSSVPNGEGRSVNN
jgi:uncharacterized protein (TIGR02099 family)